MRISVNGLGVERNIGSNDREVTGLDCDLRAIATTAKAHFPFGHFQTGVMAEGGDPKRGPDYDGLSLRGGEHKRLPGRLLLHRALQLAVFQLHATTLLA